VVLLRLEVYTFPQDPLTLEILITPGRSKVQFETLQRLSNQSRLCWFFADRDFRVFHAQQHALLEEQNNEFRTLVDDAVKHDAVVRCTGRYDACVALQAVASHYELRAAVSSRESRASTDEVGFTP
jgi:PP-loop superfamily ATP-utilizing enzyme